jgi:hypothetical protein
MEENRTLVMRRKSLSEAMRKEPLNLQVPLVRWILFAGLVSSFFGMPLSRSSSWRRIYLSEFRSGWSLVVVRFGYSMNG